MGATYRDVLANVTRGARPYAVIENVIVEESLRGRGLEKRVTSDTSRVAEDAGCDTAMLVSRSRNPATHFLPATCGVSSDFLTTV